MFSTISPIELQKYLVLSLLAPQDSMPFKIHCIRKLSLTVFTFHDISWKEIFLLGRLRKKKSIVKIYVLWSELKYQELCCKQDHQKEKEKEGQYRKSYRKTEK